jgi:hypothetical protein
MLSVFQAVFLNESLANSGGLGMFQKVFGSEMFGEIVFAANENYPDRP